MKRWSVMLPISGFVVVEVEAEDEASAIETAMEVPVTDDHIAAWEVNKHLFDGNVFHGLLRSAEARAIDDE